MIRNHVIGTFVISILENQLKYKVHNYDQQFDVKCDTKYGSIIVIRTY